MALENKVGISDSVELARVEEKISKRKAVKLFETGVLDAMQAGSFQALAEIHAYLYEKINGSAVYMKGIYASYHYEGYTVYKTEDLGGEDKRVRRTKKLIKNSFIELVLEKGFEDIRVQDVIDRADVGRTSFYTHFKSKEDVLLQSLDELGDLFGSDDLEKPSTDGLNFFTLSFFQHIEENWKLAKALMGGTKLNLVRNHVQFIFMENYKKQFHKRYSKGKTTVEIDAAATCLSGALISMILWWVVYAQAYFC